MTTFDLTLQCEKGSILRVLIPLLYHLTQVIQETRSISCKVKITWITLSVNCDCEAVWVQFSTLNNQTQMLYIRDTPQEHLEICYVWCKCSCWLKDGLEFGGHRWKIKLIVTLQNVFSAINKELICYINVTFCNECTKDGAHHSSALLKQ